VEKYSNLKTFFYFTLFFSFFIIHSQDITDTTQLKVVNLKTKIVDVKDFKQDSINSRSIQSNDGAILTPILNRIPGVVMQQGALNTSRITIRGIGARSQFSSNRLKLYFNNVPLTNANGISVLDDIDLNALGQINIIKGPKSTAYGSNLGGHIILKSFKNKDDNVEFGSTVGSFGQFQINFGTTQQLGKTELQAYANHIESNGFRENSEYERQNISLSSTTNFNENWSLENLLIATRLKAFIPSSLSQEDFLNSPESAAQNWFESAGFESYEKFILASTLNYVFNTNLKWSSTLYLSHRDGYEPRPFDILNENETGYGLRSVLDYKTTLFKRPIEFKTGVELQIDDYQAENFNNLYQNTPERESIQGDLVNAFEQDRMRVNAFVQARYEITNKLDADIGLSYNFAEYETIDLFIADGLNQSDNLSYSPKILPNLNLHYNLTSNLDFFANYSIGIATPSIDESVDEQGFFNPTLNPSFGHNYELGIMYRPKNTGMLFQLNIFQMNVEDLIVARRVEEDRFVSINAGTTRHTGLELLWDYNQNLSDDFRFNLNANLTLNDFEFTDFVDGEDDFSGNQIPAIPDYDVNLTFDLFYKNRFSLLLNPEFVGKMPLDDANSGFTDSYEVFNFRLNYFTKILNSESQLSFGVNNVLDSIYPASILPNAVSFGNSPARYFYPGIPRQFYFKVLINYRL
jgi:iron complex outermembrane receptor protein